jgi:glycosyltransferase involved in cell wall biosynthesis
MSSLGIVWPQFGPYHFARVQSLQAFSRPAQVFAFELGDLTHEYQWSRPVLSSHVITLCPNRIAERLSFATVFRRLRGRLSQLGIGVCLLPSYSPKQSRAALFAAKSLGIRTVMMNESHGGTARARGLLALVKRQLVGMFDAALVGGQPQRRYFASLGMSPDKIFTGYDAVDNDFFRQRASEIRAKAEEYRTQYLLPEHYFLSLGRFVIKKNLCTLIRAFGEFRRGACRSTAHLVLVGDGQMEPELRTLCGELGLAVYSKTSTAIGRVPPEAQAPPGVHFYGFRQIEESCIFYALADAFVLPSLSEEWGLVVNEAMASGLPVIVSQAAGCVEDLLEPGMPPIAALQETAERIAQADLVLQVRRNGFAFDPKRPAELSRTLGLMEASPELRAAMGRESQRIVERCSCENFARNALFAAEAALRAQGPRLHWTVR